MDRMEKQAYTPHEVAEILGVHPNTVYEQVRRYFAGGSGLPAFRVGRAIRIPKRIIDELIAAETQHGKLGGGSVDTTGTNL